jgi:hypothetical protein
VCLLDAVQLPRMHLAQWPRPERCLKAFLKHTGCGRARPSSD